MNRFFLLIFILLFPLALQALESITDKTKSMKKSSGFINTYLDEQTAEIYLEISGLNEELLFVTSVSQGLGSNDVGIDRGRLDTERIVFFKRVGSKILLVQPNYNFRAVTENPAEQKAVRESFAQSVLWGFKLEAESGDKVLINLTPFLLSDVQFISRWLSELKQGNYKIDTDRSALNTGRTKNFPLNSEFDAIITLTGNDPGEFIKSVTPTAESITINQHFSFIKLPDNNYKKRIYDPRAGYYGISYYDYATPIAEPLEKIFICRHRLQKQFPDRAKSPVTEPIVYYVDNGAPEPIFSALMEGASWWVQAFEEAGFENAFRVEVLPDDADPMDVRYNVIQWVHRSTRGWSYGNSVIDPRSGEIIKGHVSLGSLRVRQDFLIASGLLAPYEKGKPLSPEMEKMALARLKQLSAHEIGHTLGLRHNFAGSYNNRASVMDYPHPQIKIKNDGTPDLTNAYDNKIGDWDKIAIRYGYMEIADEKEESAELLKLIKNYISKGFKYITDGDARAQGGAHPFAHLWDNGSDAADDLEHILRVRRVALSTFSEKVINENRPYSEIETVLAPVYLMHRYAVEAASKLVGGLEYSYAVKNDQQVITRFIDPSIQEKAFKALLKTISEQELVLDEKLIQLLPPHPPGFERNRESFNSKTGITFDPLHAAESAVKITLTQIFHPERVARIIQHNHRDKSNPGMDQLYNIYFNEVFAGSFKSGLAGEIQRLIQLQTVDHLIALEANSLNAGYVKTWAFNQLVSLGDWAKKRADVDHFNYLNHRIRQFLNDPQNYKSPPPVHIPPGSPIGIYDTRSACGF